MEGKKISFSFLKTKKVEKPILEEKKDFIECLEEKSIKVVGGEQVVDEKPLVIPMKPNTLITAERLKEIAEKVESGLAEVMPIKEEKVEVNSEPADNETLDQMAVRELLQDAKKVVKIEKQELTVPVPAKPVMDGEKESTLEDYDSVPVQDFGMAMLRGMGWSSNNEQLAKYKQPQLRPKGLGLGADKVISEKQKKKASNKDDKGEELAIVKNAYVKIIAGKHSGYYGKVVSLDEDNGRVMVDITVKKETVSLGEFMMEPVTKAEFDKESKVINTNAYKEYKENEKARKDSPHTEKKRDRLNDNDKELPSSKRSNDVSRDKKQVEENKRGEKSSNGRERSNQERSRRNSTEEDIARKKDLKRDSSSSEDRSRRKTEKYRKETSSSEDRQRTRKKERNKRDSTSEERDNSSRRKKEKSRRDSSSGDRRRKKKGKKKYDSDNDSSDSISDTEKKKKHKSNRRRKDSSDSDSDSPKKDKRDIDKKRKGKKKKRDRDRSPNYKKHRK